jgi:hypothetical protein
MISQAASEDQPRLRHSPGDTRGVPVDLFRQRESFVYELEYAWPGCREEGLRGGYGQVTAPVPPL